MKPVISLKDYNTLRSLIQSHTSPKNREIGLLTEELNKSTIVKEGEIQEDLVRLDSFVEVEDIALNKRTRMKIVLPSMADLREQRISIFAPISIALLGFREGDHIEWQMPGGTKVLKIVQVKNDPA